MRPPNPGIEINTPTITFTGKLITLDVLTCSFQIKIGENIPTDVHSFQLTKETNYYIHLLKDVQTRTPNRLVSVTVTHQNIVVSVEIRSLLDGPTESTSEPEVIPHGRIPLWLITSEDVSSEAKVLYAFLEHYKNTKDLILPIPFLESSFIDLVLELNQVGVMDYSYDEKKWSLVPDLKQDKVRYDPRRILMSMKETKEHGS